MFKALRGATFKFDGRLSRGQFLRVFAELNIVSALGVVAGVFGVISGLTIAGYLFFGLVAAIYLSACGAVVRRLHDRGLPGWLLLLSIGLSFAPEFLGKKDDPLVITVLVVSALFQIWMLVQVFVLRGRTSANQYGPNPLDPGATATA